MYYPSMLLIALLIVIIFLSLPALFIMYLLMPKAVLKNYFKPPYFSKTEVTFLTGFPFFMMRTVMFMGVFAFPKMGKVRGLTEAYLMVPLWYRRLSKLNVILFMVSMGTFIPTLIFICAYATYTGEMEWF